RLTQQDYQNMLGQLGITSVRPGPSGNPNDANAANSDESKANPYSSLPNPLLLNNGKKVSSPNMWWKQRRPEIVELYDREIYGRVPKNTPGVRWELVSIRDTIYG